mmetsp:Transcript_9526/g.26797  ORF Transcript_9526/g.26797 Transcript_9526/m.26797 type:complete len:432 (+) Transcript_9526:81-1376(+)
MLASRALIVLLGASMAKATLGGSAGCLATAGIGLCADSLEDEPMAVELVQVQASRSPHKYYSPTSQLSVVVDSDAEASSPTLASATTAAALSKTSQNASQPDASRSAAMPAMVEQQANASRAAAAAAAAPSSAAAAEGSSGRAEKESAGGRQWPFGNIIDSARNAIDNVASGAVEATAAPFISAINSTLRSFDEKADAFLSYTASYKDALLLNISQSGDRKIESIQAMGLAYITPVNQLFGQVVDAVTAAGPILSQSVAALGLSSLADEVQIAMERIMEITTHIKNAIGNSTIIIGNLGELSEKEFDHALSELNSTVNYGLDAAVSLEDEFTQLVQGIMASAAEKLGITLIQARERLQDPFQEVGVTLTALVQQASQTVSKVSSGVANYLSGTYEAAKMVLSPPGENSAASGHHFLAGLAVAAACLGAGPA